jgi:hypothetical protein
MSKSRRDAKGGHAWAGYGKENKIVKDSTKRERRREADHMVRDYIPCPYCNDDGVACDLAGEIVSDPCWCVANERLETNPERSSQGWRTW